MKLVYKFATITSIEFGLLAISSLVIESGVLQVIIVGFVLLGGFIYVNTSVLGPLTDLIKGQGRKSGVHEFNMLTNLIRDLDTEAKARNTAADLQIYKSEHCSLTNCYNRMHYSTVLPIYEQSLRVFILFVDVNNLKKMNDVYGHKAGDALIKSAADKLRFWNRFGDVYRMGGDEFLVVVMNKTEEFCMEQLKAWEETLTLLNRKSDGFECALSYGTAFGDRNDDFRSLVQLADERMYEMKQRIKGAGNAR